MSLLKTSDPQSQRAIERIRKNQEYNRAAYRKFIDQIDEHFRIYGNYGMSDDELKEIERGFIRRYKQFEQDIKNIEAYDKAKRLSDLS